jgi:hypothetical protein
MTGEREARIPGREDRLDAEGESRREAARSYFGFHAVLARR